MILDSLVNRKTILPAKKISGSIKVSGDKSISHRSLIFTSLASGNSTIKNFLFAQDCINTLKVFKKLGVRIIKQENGNLKVYGKGRYGLKKPRGKLNFGNSATGMRLMAGVLSAQNFSSVLKGDSSLSVRPMSRITKPLSKMGANITAEEGEHPPLTIEPGRIKGIKYKSPIASAQVKSCILLAGLYSEKPTTVTEPYKSRDHTERMMEYFGLPVKVDGNTVQVKGETNWPGKSITVPGDFSSAAFFITAALIIPFSRLEIRDVNLNPTRCEFLEVIKKMNGKIEIKDKKVVCNEPKGNIKVSYSDLKSISISENIVPKIIDEIPLIALLATRAQGKTIINGLGELRKKETDRLRAISTQLSAMGQSVQEQGNSLVIHGKKGNLKGSEVISFGDHRIAMMLCIAGLAGEGKTRIKGIKCIKTSFPEFFNLLDETIER